MTEAMSRHEIEDVLSSIRRLVSQDPQGKQQGHAPEKPPLTGKLVLTSELRIGPPAAGAQEKSHAPVDDTAIVPEPLDRTEQPDPTPSDSLLTRIKSAGNTRPDPAPTEPQDSAETGAPVTSLEDAALEATLSRLESMLAAGGAPQPAHNQPAAHQPAAEPPARAAQTESTDQLIDESILQQLVAQIVRQELQGELGEKITRSIRKLVRAEVARELALRQK